MGDYFWFSDAQWARIEPLLPTDVRGMKRVDDRRVLSGIVHALQSGGRWSDCPSVYGPRKTLYNRFVHVLPLQGLAKGRHPLRPQYQMLHGHQHHRRNRHLAALMSPDPNYWCVKSYISVKRSDLGQLFPHWIRLSVLPLRDEIPDPPRLFLRRIAVEVNDDDASLKSIAELAGSHRAIARDPPRPA